MKKITLIVLLVVGMIAGIGTLMPETAKCNGLCSGGCFTSANCLQGCRCHTVPGALGYCE